MKNLSSFGVQELNAKEIKETQGGCNPFRWLWDLWHESQDPNNPVMP